MLLRDDEIYLFIFDVRLRRPLFENLQEGTSPKLSEFSPKAGDTFSIFHQTLFLGVRIQNKPENLVKSLKNFLLLG